MAALDFLKKNGYLILESNFRNRFGEIDIIAVKERIIVFCEVKLRSGNFFGSPIESIDERKIKKIKNLALFYISKKIFNKDFDIRFDVIEIIIDSSIRDFINKNIHLFNPLNKIDKSIYFSDDQFLLKHTENAF